MKKGGDPTPRSNKEPSISSALESEPSLRDSESSALSQDLPSRSYSNSLSDSEMGSPTATPRGSIDTIVPFIPPVYETSAFKALAREPEEQRKMLIQARRELENDISKEFNKIAVEHTSQITSVKALGTSQAEIRSTLSDVVHQLNFKRLEQNKLKVKSPLKNPEKSLFALKPKELVALQAEVQALDLEMSKSLSDAQRLSLS